MQLLLLLLLLAVFVVLVYVRDSARCVGGSGHAGAAGGADGCEFLFFLAVSVWEKGGSARDRLKEASSYHGRPAAQEPPAAANGYAGDVSPVGLCGARAGGEDPRAAKVGETIVRAVAVVVMVVVALMVCAE
jgi:hypothetical protein